MLLQPLCRKLGGDMLILTLSELKSPARVFKLGLGHSFLALHRLSISRNSVRGMTHPSNP